MKKRLHSILRVLGVERDLHRVEEQRLAALNRRETALAAERQELIAALDGDQVFYGSFIYPMAKRLRSIDEAAARLARDKDKQARKVLRQAGRKKHAERLYATVSSGWERSEAKRDLMDLVDRAASPAKTSLP